MFRELHLNCYHVDVQRLSDGVLDMGNREIRQQMYSKFRFRSSGR